MEFKIKIYLNTCDYYTKNWYYTINYYTINDYHPKNTKTSNTLLTAYTYLNNCVVIFNVNQKSYSNKYYLVNDKTN